MPLPQAHLSAPLLFVGDIHLGRRPESLAHVLEDLQIPVRDVSPHAAWENAVQYAMDHGVKAVVLTGDVIDKEEHFVESYQLVERGVRRLNEAGIPVIAVAGNHDATLLPRLADAVEGVTLLGRGGRWASHVLTVDGNALELIGWSFPRAHVQENPLDDPALEALLKQPRKGARRILIAHGDLDAKRSNYAPMQRAQLEGADVDAAFLGHIHKPDPLHAARPIGYLGSLTGLDIAETGIHGPVEVRLAGDGRVVAQRIANAPIRWERLAIDVSRETPWSAEALLKHVRQTLSTWTELHPLAAETRVLALRLSLEGRRPLEGWTASLEALQTFHGRAFEMADTRAFAILERTVDATALTIDLHAESQERTPIGRVARMILNGPTPAQLREAERQIDAAYEREDVEQNGKNDVRQALQAAAQRMLEHMVTAREQGGAQ